MEDKLKSAEKQRELQNQQKTERQRIQEERIAKARKKREKLQADDVISDVEQDDNFNNDDGKIKKLRIYCDPTLLLIAALIRMITKGSVSQSDCRT